MPRHDADCKVRYTSLGASFPGALTGSLAPLDALPYQLIATIPYSSLVVGGKYYSTIPSLHGNARSRLFAVYSSINETVSAQLAISDSNIGTAAASEGAHGTTPDALYPSSGLSLTATSPVQYASSQVYPGLAEAGNALFGVWSFGATAPTTGNIYVWVKEVL